MSGHATIDTAVEATRIGATFKKTDHHGRCSRPLTRAEPIAVRSGTRRAPRPSPTNHPHLTVDVADDGQQLAFRLA
jgi:hypothetical protein